MKKTMDIGDEADEFNLTIIDSLSAFQNVDISRWYLMILTS